MTNNDARQLTLEAIVAGCRRETERFLQSLTSDAVYCYELFRRAIIKRDTEAGDAVVKQFWESTQKKVRKWLGQYEAFRFEPDPEATVQNCITDAFGRFWISYKPTHFMQSRGLPDVLAYLSKCASSAVGQWAREHAYMLLPMDEPLTGAGSEADDVQEGEAVDAHKMETEFQRQEFIRKAHECFMRHCADDVDRQLVRRVAIEGVRLEEVYTEMRPVFRRRQDIYQRWRTFKDRVAKDKECRQLLSDSQL